jgi:hypothetical protein
MHRTKSKSQYSLVKEQGARALVASIHGFLRANGVPKRALTVPTRGKDGGNLRTYRRMMSAYRDVAVLMAGWFTHPRFLDSNGQPVPLTRAEGPHSVEKLIKHSRVRVPSYLAWEMLTCSPSIRLNSNGTLTARRRVLVLPEFEVPRAALVVERYLDTLRRNASSRNKSMALLLERNCFVSDIDLGRVAPTLRDIKERGAAFMDAVDGEIEGSRPRRTTTRALGELGVVVFAWTRPNRVRKKTGGARLGPKARR